MLFPRKKSSRGKVDVVSERRERKAKRDGRGDRNSGGAVSGEGGIVYRIVRVE